APAKRRLLTLLCQMVKTKRGIALLEPTEALQSSEALAGIESPLVFRDDRARRRNQRRSRKKSQGFCVGVPIAVRRIEKAEVAAHGLRIQQAQRALDLALLHLKA